MKAFRNLNNYKTIKQPNIIVNRIEIVIIFKINL